jgi:hypothetical protein
LDFFSRFPVERMLGEYVEDGKCELELEVWKHPEHVNLIEYEILCENGDETEKYSGCRSYVVIYGSNGRTCKVELNDGNYDFGSIDTFEFYAPDIGKVNYKYNVQMFF